MFPGLCGESGSRPCCSGNVGQDLTTGMIPLFAAAALAYEQVFSTRRTQGVAPSVDELDLVALALSSQLPIYGVRSAGRDATRISDEELLQGMFWGGAMRFELGLGAPAVTHLQVQAADLERVLERLKRRPREL
jgi:hypothetical protein